MIGYTDGMTINGVGARSAETSTDTSWNNQSYGAGIAATNGAYVGLGPHFAVNRFYYGVMADNNGFTARSPEQPATRWAQPWRTRRNS
jgi:hypothetical protein